MTIGCNIWMICLKLNWFFYGLSDILQFSEFVWALSYSVWDVFNNFLLIDTTDRSKISIDQKRFFIALSLYPLSRTLPLKSWISFFNGAFVNVRFIKTDGVRPVFFYLKREGIKKIYFLIEKRLHLFLCYPK